MNWKILIGIALLLCWPTLVLWEGLYAWHAPKWYYSTAIIERRGASVEEMNKAFQEIAPNSKDALFKVAENTDTVVTVIARDQQSQPASDKANSIATAMIAKVPKHGSQSPKIVFPAHPEIHPITVPLGVNLLFGCVVGLIPALAGLTLVLRGRRARPATL